MKGVIGLAVFLVLVYWALSFFLATALTADQGKNLAIAYNEPFAGVFEIQVGIGQRVTMREPPRYTPTGAPLWEEWIEGHFQLRDEKGNRVPLKRMGTSALFTGSRGGGDPDFILVAEIKKQVQYVFDYVPVLSEGKTYRYTFTSPSQAEDSAGWQIFALAEEG